MHKNVFTPENAAMLLIDHQVGTISWTHSHDVEEVKKNALNLAKIATAVDMSLVLTSSSAVCIHFHAPQPHGFSIDAVSQGGASGSPIFRRDDPAVLGMLYAAFERAGLTYAMPGHLLEWAVSCGFIGWNFQRQWHSVTDRVSSGRRARTQRLAYS